MPTPSTKLGLSLPTQGDRFSTADLRSNWEKLDLSPGRYICSSTTRPTTWTTAQIGRSIYETNTRLEWVWTGSGWIRSTGGQGILRRSDGTFAIAERTTNFSTNSDTFVRVLSLTGVVVPAGNRPLMVVGAWFQADNAQGPFPVVIMRSNTNEVGPTLGKMNLGQSPAEKGSGNSLISFERNGYPAGTYDFSIQVRRYPNVGGTSWMYGDATQPIQLTVIEL